MNLRDLFLAMNLGGSGGSGGGNYTLPVASPTVLGGVKPAAKSDDMTEPVGVDASGKLFTNPGGGGGGEKWEPILAWIAPRPTLVNLGGMEGVREENDSTPYVTLSAAGTVKVTFPLGAEFKKLYFRVYGDAIPICTSGKVKLAWGPANSNHHNFPQLNAASAWTGCIWQIDFTEFIRVLYSGNGNSWIARPYDSYHFRHTNQLVLSVVDSGATFNDFGVEIWGVRA